MFKVPDRFRELVGSKLLPDSRRRYGMKPAVFFSVLSVAVVSLVGLARHQQPDITPASETPAPDTAEKEGPEEPILFVG